MPFKSVIALARGGVGVVGMDYLPALIEVLPCCSFSERLGYGEAVEIFLEVDELVACYLIFFMNSVESFRNSICKNHREKVLIGDDIQDCWL